MPNHARWPGPPRWQSQIFMNIFFIVTIYDWWSHAKFRGKKFGAWVAVYVVKLCHDWCYLFVIFTIIVHQLVHNLSPDEFFESITTIRCWCVSRSRLVEIWKYWTEPGTNCNRNDFSIIWTPKASRNTF